MIERINMLIKEHKYNELRKELLELNEVDIASLLEILPDNVLINVFRLLPKDTAADVFSYLSIEIEQALITSLSDSEAADILDNLYSDDAADLLEEMPANVVKRLLGNATNETRRNINHLLRYPEDSAGSIMTVEFIKLHMHYTVEQALIRLRNEGAEQESIDVSYVVDSTNKLIGLVNLRDLLFSDNDKLIKDIMDENVISVNTHMDQEEVSEVFSKYDFNYVPVTDSENRLVGVITVDDIVDIIKEEATEDIEIMAAITPSEHPYLKTSVFTTFKQRIPWLLLLMISATFTGKIIRHYETALTSCVILTSFIPMLTDTGGNSGSQASVTIIRGLSLGEITFKDFFHVAGKEFLVSLLCGGVLALANFAKMLFLDNVPGNIALVVSLTLLSTVIIAKLVGSALPILAKRVGLDPAVVASPFLTTIVDALALIIYFFFAMRILNL